MTTDEIIEFLDQIEESIRNKYNVHEGRQRAGARNQAAADKQGNAQQYNLKQKFLEQVTQDQRTEGRYFTMLGLLLIEKCVSIRDPATYTRDDKDKLENARTELQKFLETKDQYK